MTKHSHVSYSVIEVDYKDFINKTTGDNMATIENFATVRFTSGGVAATRTSNLAEVGLESAVNFTKTAVGNNYDGNGIVTYILSAVNTSASPINNITVRDDLVDKSRRCWTVS